MEILIKGHGRVPIYFLRVAFDFDELPFEQFVEEVPELRRKSWKKKCGCDCVFLEVNKAKSLEGREMIKQIPHPQSRLRQMNKITSVSGESRHTCAPEGMGKAEEPG